MNFKRLIFLLIIIFIVRNPFFLQFTDIEFSKVEKKEADQTRIDFFHLEDQYMLFLSNRDKEKVIVHVYDSLLHHKSRSVLDLGGQTPLKVQLINNVPILFSKITNSNNEQELYSHNIALNGLLSSTLLITKYKNHGGNLTKYKLSVSENSKHISVLVEHPFEKEKHEKISVLTLNKDFKIKAEYHHALEQSSKNKRINVPIVTNKGTIYLLKRYWDKGNKYYLATQKGAEFSQSELKLRNRKIADLKYAISNEDKLILCGFFTSPIRFNFEGVFSYRFNNSTHPEYKKEAYLTEKVVTAFKHKKDIKENGFGLDHFKAKNLLLDTLGNQYLLAEHHVVENLKTGTIHKSKGVLLVKFTKSGSYVWSSPLLTKQKEQNKYSKWITKIPFMYDNNFCLLYNNTDNEKTNKLDQLYGLNTLYGTHLVEFNKLGVSNNHVITELHNNLDERFAFCPKIILQEDQNIYFITENSTKTKFRIVKMNLN